MASKYVKRATIQAATDASMASEIRNAGTETRAEIIILIDGRIAGNPAVVAAAAAAVNAALADAELRPKKCIRFESGVPVWDLTSAATHYVIYDDQGAPIIRPTIWPAPTTTPGFNW